MRVLTEESDQSEAYLDYCDTQRTSPRNRNAMARSPMSRQISSHQSSRHDQVNLNPQISDYRLEERATLRSNDNVSKEVVAHADRPFDKLNNQAILYRCTICQNHKDGLKTTDYKLSLLGCVIQGNIASALRVVNPGEAEAYIYLKSKNNESDLIGRLVSSNGRYQPRIQIESALSHLFRELKTVQ